MARQVLKILLFFIPALLYVRCAQQVPLSGGKKDTIPPKPVSATPANNSTHFNSELIVLQFNEYVKLNDLTNQLVISPKLKTTPEVETDRKSIRISLKKEELSPNTTYRFSFGRAVADMNEGNVLPNFEYVFSTGDAIDSLRIKGQVLDAFTNKPLASILIGLYPDKQQTDSLPYKEAPEYTGKSNESGEFNFRNLPYHTFKAYAFDDKNKNLTYDGESEKIGFMDANLNLRSDTVLGFRLFQEESAKSFIKKTVLPYAGLAQILLNKKIKVSVAALKRADSSAIYETKPGTEKDTIFIYYKDIADTLGLVINSSTKSDTLKIALSKKAAVKRKFKNYSANTSGNTLPLNTPLTLTFSNWMDILNANGSDLKLTSAEDSSAGLMPVTGRWLDINHYEITNTLKEGLNYTLKIDTCAFLDVNGICNDSLRANFKTESRLEFGKVTLKLLLNKKQPYTVQLLNDKNEVARESHISFSLSSSNAVSLDFIDIRPGTYLVKIIYDDNGNHKWDTGNLLLKRQPERVIINSKQIKVLSDWEIEEEIQVKE
jgi:hypothetical protein